jgi:serine/threonine protein kinase
MSLTAGTKLGPYEILQPIGVGGMGEVYKARDTRLNRLVALKISRQEFSERFEREAVAIAQLNHPQICQPYDVDTNYLVMEFVVGTPLNGPLPLKRAVAYAEKILDARRSPSERDHPWRSETGQILGTLQYRSPEQLQGKEVDARSDLLAFGCVLYEMLSGKRAFAAAARRA